MDNEGSNSARVVIEQIWYRARINAFAHRAAFLEYSEKARHFFRHELVAALFSIVAVILVYFVSSLPDSDFSRQYKMYLTILFTLLSIVFTVYSLYKSVMANYLKLDVKAASHEQLVNRYQFIAQRAREIKWPDLPGDDVIALLKDLERDFQLLKATGNEPEDHHFDKAHEIFHKIRLDKDTQIAQSFEVGALERNAKGIGDPNLPKTLPKSDGE